jgi:hypothetical protein
MKVIVDVDLPVEPFNTFIRKGTAGEKSAGLQQYAAI